MGAERRARRDNTTLVVAMLLQLQKNDKRLIRLAIVMASGIVEGNPPKTIAE